MKWQAIANVTGQIKEASKDYLIYKLQKDASVELPALWGDFESETTQHLHGSQSNIEVLPSSKTGGLSCVTKFDELHPDFSYNDKPFTNYILDKYDERAKSLVASTRNPITRKSLENRIAEHRNKLSLDLNHTDIKLIEGKRHMMAIEGVEKYKKITYDNPHNYEANLNDCINSLSVLSLLPIDKERRINEAKLELAGAAAQGTLKNSPDTLINQMRLPPEAQPLWIQHLSLEQRIKLDNQLKHREEHRQIMRQHEIGSAIKANKASVLETGESVKGIDDLVIAACGKDSRQFQQFKQDESLYKKAFSVTDQIKHASFNDGSKILEAFKPVGGDPDFYNKQNIYNMALKLYDDQLRQAATDPARLVEELYIDEMPKNLTFPQRIMWRITLQQKKGIPSYGQQYLTKAEKAEFIRKIEDSKDINEIRSTIDGIISLRDNNGNNYGLEVMQELLKGRDSELLTSFYSENMLYGDEHKANIFLKMIPFKGQLFNKGKENLLNKEIAGNKVINNWEKGFYNQDTQNTEEINYTKEQIKYLASHYTKSGELSPEKAVERATEEVIENRYISVAGGKFQIHRRIISNNKIQHLNEDYIDASLSELKTGIINGNIPYLRGNEPDNEYAKEMVEEALRTGRWNLTPDKKSVS